MSPAIFWEIATAVLWKLYGSVNIVRGGDLLWTRTYNGLGVCGYYGEGTDVTVGPDGYVYLTGSEYVVPPVSSLTPIRLVLQKYHTDGTLLWTRTYSAPGHTKTRGVDLVTDGQALYVATELDWYGIALLKFNMQGNYIASTTLYNNNGGRGFYWKYFNVRLLNDRVYWAGTICPTSSCTDWLRVTDLNLNEIWTRTFTATGAYGFDVRGSLLVRAGGGTGGFGGPICGWGRTALDLFVHDLNGDLRWSISTPFVGPGITTAIAYAVKIDSQENIYVTGWASDNKDERSNILLAKFSRCGKVMWARTAVGTQLIDPTWTCYLDWGIDITQDQNDDLIVAGQVWKRASPSTFQHFWVAKFEGIKETPAALSASIAVSPDPPLVGQLAQVMLTVTNTGGEDATGVSSTLFVGPGASLVAYQSGPVPLGPLTLAAGGAATFTWTYSVSGAGGVAFTGTVSGIDVATDCPVVASSTATLTTTAPAILTAAMTVTPSPAFMGQWVQIMLTVTNTGGGTANSVSPSLQTNSGGTLVVYQIGPSPSGPLMLAPGSTTTFVWTYSVSGTGTVSFTGTVSGTDAGSGAPVMVSASQSVMTALPSGGYASLVANLSAVPNPVNLGEWIQVVLVLSNTGTGFATQVSPSLNLDSGGALLVAISGPVPAGPVTMSAGGSQSFTWTYSVSGIGTVLFTGGASGIDFTSGMAVNASATVVGTLRAVTAPPGQIWVGSTSGRLPFFPSRGEALTVRVNTAETGQAKVVVYNLLWEEVAVVYEGSLSPGPMELRWDGRNINGSYVAVGIYLVKLELPGKKAVIKRIIVGK